MEPTRFELGLRRPEKVMVRRQSTRPLPRIFEFARLTIDDVVNDPGAKRAVLGWYRAAEACEWESLRTHLAERIAFERWIRENR